jgi:hypothetical protein
MEQVQTKHGIFTSNEFTGQTAQEVYEDWLAQKDRPTEPTTEERIEALELAMLEVVLGG